MITKPHKVSEKEIYRGRKISLKIEEYMINDVKFKVEKVEHPGAVVIIPVGEEDNIIYLKQYRAPIDKWIIELPAGTIKENEEIEETAKRELLEEVGYETDNLTLIGSIYPSPGYSSEILYIFVARNLVKSKPKREPHEILIVEKAPLKDLLDMVYENKIKDAKTIAALILYSKVNNKILKLE